MILARLLSAAPQTDGESWRLQFRFHSDVWHTDAYAQNPAPYQRNPQSAIPSRPPYPWQPNGFTWPSADVLFQQAGMAVKVNTGNSPATLDLFGSIPVNTPPKMNAPQCPLFAAVSTTGGLLTSGTYLIAISADLNGPVSPYFIQAVIPPGTTTGSITISGCVWGAVAPSISIYAGTNSLNMTQIIFSAYWSGSVPDSFGNPTTFTISQVNIGYGPGLPDPVFDSFLFQVKNIIHGGVWGAQVTSSTTGPPATARFAGASWTTNQWAGYIVSSYTRGLDLEVASNTADTLTFTGSSSITFPAGDVVVMRAKAGSITSNTVGDANFVNFYGPSGLTTDAEVGNLIRIIAGTGKGQPPVAIASNTATVLTIAGTWSVMPDATSIFIVEAPGWAYAQSTGSLRNDGTIITVPPTPVGSIPLSNLQGGALLIEAITVDANGNWSVERYAPIREIWLPPSDVMAPQASYNQ